MSLLIDTNVVLRLAQISSSDHQMTRSAILIMADLDLSLCIVPQVVFEFWVVATRPVNVNGLGMDIDTAGKSMEGILGEFQLLKDERGVFDHWKSLVTNYKVMGKPAHDAGLVAAMQRHGLTNLLTFNKADFARFNGIRVYTPAEVLSGQVPS